MKSKLFSLDVKDLLRGALIALLTAIATSMIHVIEAGNLMLLFEWETVKMMLIAGLSAGIMYLLKNFLTNQDDKPLMK